MAVALTLRLEATSLDASVDGATLAARPPRCPPPATLDRPLRPIMRDPSSSSQLRHLIPC